MVCPRCRVRRPRRHCPALQAEICPSCCGTGRLTEIACPASCGYLSSAQAHPPAVVRKQQAHDGLFLVAALDGLPPRQQELALVVLGFATRAAGDTLLRPTDDDVRQAFEALASTYETSGKGLIYEHRPDSLVAQRVCTDARAFLDTVGGQGGKAFEAEAALVLRRLAQAIAQVRSVVDEGPTTCLDMAGRMLKTAGVADRAPEGAGEPAATGPGLIAMP